MKPYRLHEADLELPDDWEDNSINAFSLPGGKTNAANFVITRDRKTKSSDVRAYADQQLVEAAKKLRGYRLIERRETEISGQGAVEVDYTWRTPDRIDVQQRQSYVQWKEVFVILTLTARQSSFSQYVETWDKIVQTIKLQPSE